MTTTDIVPRAASDLATLPDIEPGITPPLPADLITVAGKLLGEDFAGIYAVLAGTFERMEWAEQEITAAQARHPHRADRIWHSFSLLLPNPGMKRMETEMVYRAHCREILDRVADDEDTRPGTAAEVCCAMLSTGLLAPLTSTATGLYMRMWQAGGFPEFDAFTEARRHHEALEHSTIDDHERFARRKLAVSVRRLGDIDCFGRHHGEQVDCIYAPTSQLAIKI